MNNNRDAGVDQQATAELHKVLVRRRGDKAGPEVKAKYEKTWADVTRNPGDPPGKPDAKSVPVTRCLEFDPAGDRVSALRAAGVGGQVR